MNVPLERKLVNGMENEKNESIFRFFRKK